MADSPPRDGAGAGGRHSPGVIPTTLGIPDFKISGLRTSDMCWSSPGKNSRRLYAKAAGCGASPGRDAGFGAGLRDGGLRRGWFEKC